MWIWILAALGLFAVAKARASTITTQAQTTTGATGAQSTPGIFPSPAREIRVDNSPIPVPPTNATTVTDAPENLASAYLVYSTILRNKLALAGNGTPFTTPGAPSYGGGGSGGGRGSIGCPVEGTEILCLGMSHFESEKFEADTFVTVKAGEYELTATPSHKLYTAEKGIVFLGDLRQGDHVITHGGERSVSSVFRFSEKKTALRIHVPESHLYFANGILSHNKA